MAAEVNWDRLDKQRFFTIGVGLFSGITTFLYPLSVVKTRQMAAEGVAGGLSGTKAVAATIWRQDGLRGFYRGFGTVVFGTIPARVVYLTTLEVTKSGMTKIGEQLDLAPATLAATSSFMAGGAASLSTQAVVVPIDVVSQRLMMQGVETNHTIASSRPAAAAAAAAAAEVGGRAAGGSSSGPASSSSSSSSSSPDPTKVAAKPAAGPPGGGAPAQPQEQQRRGFSTRAGHRPAGCSSSSGAGPGPGSRLQLAAPLGSSSSSICVHTVRAQGSATSGTPVGCSLPAAAAAARCSPYSLSSRRRLATAAAAVPSNGWQMARAIVAEEGVRGLYRGFLPSVATFVPSSAVWWGAYGFWQKVIWMHLIGEGGAAHPQQQQQQQWKSSSTGTTNGNVDSSSSSSSSSRSTGRVVGVQVASSVLAGCTAALATNPLDLVKTRMQLAEVSAGAAAPSWRAVAGALLAEEGVAGLWRGVAPRMVSSACWGTAMVSSYEYLKRICALPPP